MNQQDKTYKRPACDGCKTYRVKCVKVGTSCRNCMDLELECTYTIVPKKRGPKVGYKRNKEVDTNNNRSGEFVMYEANTTNKDIVLVEKVGSPNAINEVVQPSNRLILPQNYKAEPVSLARESSSTCQYNVTPSCSNEGTTGSYLMPSTSSGSTTSPHLIPTHLTPKMTALDIGLLEKPDDFALDSNQIDGSYEENNRSYNSLGYLSQQDTNILTYSPILNNDLPNPRQGSSTLLPGTNVCKAIHKSNFINNYIEEYQAMFNNVTRILNSYVINVEKLNQYLSEEPNFPSVFTELILYNLASLGCTLQRKLTSADNLVEQANILECEIAKRTCILPQTMLEFEKNEFSIYINNLAYEI